MSRDPRLLSKWWRMTHLYKIKDKDGKLVTFKPNFTQLKHLQERKNHRRGRILKYRQGGFTTLYCIDELDDAIFTPGFSAAVLAHEREALDKIFQIIERAFDNMPESIKPTTRQDTLRMLRFEKAFDGTPLDSSIYVALKLRSGTVQRLHVTERAYIVGEKSQELEAGSKQAVPISGWITEETTANGMDEFHDAFMENWQKEGLDDLDYRSYFYAWHEDPQYTLPGKIQEYTQDDLRLKELIMRSYGKELTDGQVLWYAWKKRELMTNSKLGGLRPDQLMKQEYPSTVLEAFQSGLGSVFDLEKLANAKPTPPIRTLEDGTQIWKEPEDGHHYVMGADPSGGDAEDLTVIDIWDKDTREQVAQWAGKIRPDEAAEKARDLAEMYHQAFVGIENNMLSMVLFFVKIYDNYYAVVVEDEKTKRQTRKVGWNTNSKTRDPMIDEFVMLFEEETIKINSALTLKQMMTFVKKENGKREHADGKHDDAIFAAMIAQQMVKHYKDKNRRTVFTRKPTGF